MNSKINFSFLRDKKVQRSWIGLVVTWAIIRALVLNDIFGSYGINGWGYFAVDLGSGIPYAIYSGRAVIDFMDKNWEIFRKNGLISIILFYIPDIYVLTFARKVPRSLLIGFLTSIVLFTAFAIWGIRRDVEKNEIK